MLKRAWERLKDFFRQPPPPPAAPTHWREARVCREPERDVFTMCYGAE